MPLILSNIILTLINLITYWMTLLFVPNEMQNKKYQKIFTQTVIYDSNELNFEFAFSRK